MAKNGLNIYLRPQNVFCWYFPSIWRRSIACPCSRPIFVDYTTQNQAEKVVWSDFFGFKIQIHNKFDKFWFQWIILLNRSIKRLLYYLLRLLWTSCMDRNRAVFSLARNYRATSLLVACNFLVYTLLLLERDFYDTKIVACECLHSLVSSLL